MSDSYTISAGKIHTGNDSQDDAYLTVDGKSISSVGKNPEQRADYDLSDYILTISAKSPVSGAMSIILRIP